MPRYEFGFGLSYTTFEYLDMSVTVSSQTALASTYPAGAWLWEEKLIFGTRS